MATVPQMRARMLDPHRAILRACADDARIGEWTRGHSTALRTLLRWGAVRSLGIVDGLARYEITETGRALVAHR